MGSNRIRTRQAHAARTKEAATKSPEEQHEEVTRANTERILRALDDFANPAARLGVGSSNLLEGTQYPLTRITRLYMLMQSLYRSNWVAQRIADTYPELMCKVPPVLTCQVKPKDLDSFYRAIEQYQVWAKLEWTMKLANVFGGAGAAIIIDGHENFLDEPLDLDDIKPGAFKGIIPFDRWSGINPGGTICNDINRPMDYGLPESYQVTTATGGTFNVHTSRVLRFTGKDLQLWEQQSEMWWGESLFEAAWEEIKKRDNMSFNIVSLMFRAQILGLKIPELAQIISGVGMPGPAAQQFQRTLQAQSDAMSNQGLALFGKDGGFESSTYSFGGMAEVYHELMKDVAASAEIPYELLFGREGGLGANGETSLQILYDRVGHKQKTKVHPQLQKLYPVVAMSVWGEVPKDFGWKFPTPRTMSNKERAELADALTKPVIEAFNAGLISQKTSLMEFQQNADTTEVFSNITDADVAKADDEVAKPMEMGGGEAGETGEGGEFGQGEQGNAGSPHSKEPRPAGGSDRAVDAGGDKATVQAAYPKAKVVEGVGGWEVHVNGASISDYPRSSAALAWKALALTVRSLPRQARDAEYPGGTAQAALAAQGIETVIETHKGQQRRFADFRGINVPFDYGYIVGTSGADGDEVDCYIGPALSAPFAYVVDQNKVGSTTEFDEHKVMLGFTTIQQAKAAYMAGHTQGAAIFRSITAMPLEEFKAWLAAGQQTKPLRGADAGCAACDSGDCLKH